MSEPSSTPAARSDWPELLALLAEAANVREVLLLPPDSDAVTWRLRVLLPVVGRRLGRDVPTVLAAAAAGDFERSARRVGPRGRTRLARR